MDLHSVDNEIMSILAFQSDHKGKLTVKLTQSLLNSTNINTFFTYVKCLQKFLQALTDV